MQIYNVDPLAEKGRIGNWASMSRGSHLYVPCRIKLNQLIKAFIESRSRDQGSLQTTKTKGSRCAAII